MKELKHFAKSEDLADELLKKKSIDNHILVVNERLVYVTAKVDVKTVDYNNFVSVLDLFAKEN